MKVGLTLGKYAPLHLGHQFVIESALQEMDRVLVMIYDSPATTVVPLEVRAKWIKDIYPQVVVIEAWDGPEETGYTPDIMKAQEDYILATLKGQTVTHFYSSEAYGEHVSKALCAVDRRVDMKRVRIPVSATQIRNDLEAHTHFLHPIVLASLRQ